MHYPAMDGGQRIPRRRRQRIEGPPSGARSSDGRGAAGSHRRDLRVDSRSVRPIAGARHDRRLGASPAHAYPARGSRSSARSGGGPDTWREREHLSEGPPQSVSTNGSDERRKSGQNRRRLTAVRPASTIGRLLIHEWLAESASPVETRSAASMIKVNTGSPVGSCTPLGTTWTAEVCSILCSSEAAQALLTQLRRGLWRFGRKSVGRTEDGGIADRNALCLM
jgi:hypothetical protein